MSWDLKAILAVLIGAAVGIVIPVVVVWVRRTAAFYRMKQHRGAYLPHSTSHKPWEANKWRQRPAQEGATILIVTPEWERVITVSRITPYETVKK